MPSAGIYALMGFTLLIISLFGLSVFLQPSRRNIAEFVSRQIKRIYVYGLLISLFLILQWIAGIWILVRPGEEALILMKIGGICLWAVLVLLNAVMTYILLKNGYRPVLSKDLVDIVVYFAVLYLVLEKFTFPWVTVGVVSTILTVLMLYMLNILIRYSRMFEDIVEPVNLYTLVLGFRIFSGLVGLMLVSLAYSQDVFRELVVFSYLFFTVILLYSIRGVRAVIQFSR